MEELEVEPDAELVVEPLVLPPAVPVVADVEPPVVEVPALDVEAVAPVVVPPSAGLPTMIWVGVQLGARAARRMLLQVTTKILRLMFRLRASKGCGCTGQ